ncbi:LacI family DNA-binding transcriptional regulator [Nonomuraea phyllanthi]|uniref:LacI family DNA-binding transcriptional regulator n=2 Tax=Nonomuraea phyllanthi TaxID=2219224 RepID=A0A5C4W6V4_9ACTN|nr:LacI family DNA-binding transcriptional regulator [Nonomuraea phyllanthi]
MPRSVDVARLARVSQKTVSRVFNNEQYVSDEVRGRVLAAAEHLGYRLNNAAGVHYDEFGNLTRDLPVRAAPGSPLDLPEGASATCWVDGLTVLSDADVLATYEHPHFGRWPAITTRRHGRGRVTYVGTVPGRALARALALWLAPTPVSGWSGLPASVTAATGTSPGGRRVHVVHNWSWEPARVRPPLPLSDALAGAPVPAGRAGPHRLALP